MRSPIPFVCALLLCSLAAAVTGAHAAVGDDRWSDAFVLRGADATVTASAEIGGDLVIGGSFTEIDGIALSRVARWNGSTWEPMGDGFDAEVLALVVWNGHLYAGGAFTESGAQSTYSLARWNGSNWEPVAGGVPSGTVHALVGFGSQLVVGGDFDRVGDGIDEVATEGVAFWDGSAWSSANTGFHDSEYGYVNALAVHAGALYAGGFFLSVSGGSGIAQHVARYTGSDWVDVGGGVQTDGDWYSGEVYDLVSYDGVLFVAGYFNEVGGGVSCDGVAAWGGTFWELRGFLAGYGQADELAVVDGQLYVTAYDILYRHDTPIAMDWVARCGLGGVIDHLGAHGTSLVIGGAFSSIDGTGVRGIALFDGNTISAPGSGQGLDANVNRLFVWNGALIAGGTFEIAGDANGASRIAAWSGATWSGLAGGASGNGGVLSFAEFQGDLVAGGSFTSMGGVLASRVARWDGTSWSPMGSGSVSSVTALGTWNGQLYAHGDLSGFNGSVLRWDEPGSTWVVVGANTLGGDVAHLLEYDGELIAAGQFDSIDGVIVDHIARYDGSTWSSLGDGVDGGQFTRIFGARVHDGLLYIAGDFTLAGSTPVSYVAIWDGTSWSSLGGGVGAPARDVLVIDDDVYVSGTFTSVGGGAVAAARVARFDGVQWHALGSGLDNSGTSLAEFGGQLMVGGAQSNAGGRPSSRISAWDLQNAPTSAPGRSGETLLALPATPNPFGESTAVRFVLGNESMVVVDVHDARGRRVSRMHDGVRPAGLHQFVWDGRDGNGRVVANGTYFLSIRTGGATSRAKVTLVR